MIDKGVKVGDTFVCPVCKRTTTVQRDYHEMVALYETAYGIEFDNTRDELVLVCSPCGKLLYERTKPCGNY